MCYYNVIEILYRNNKRYFEVKILNIKPLLVDFQVEKHIEK